MKTNSKETLGFDSCVSILDLYFFLPDFDFTFSILTPVA